MGRGRPRGGGPGGAGLGGELPQGPQLDSPVYCRLTNTRAMTDSTASSNGCEHSVFTGNP